MSVSSSILMDREIAECEKLIKQHLEALQKRAGYITPILDNRSSEVQEWEQIRNQVWKDRTERRAKKSCARCGLYYQHSIRDIKTPDPIEYYDGPELFHKIDYKIETKKIVKENNVTDEFYDLCDKCIDHGRGMKAFDLPTESEITKQMLKLKQQENRRRWLQEDALTKAKAVAAKRRKEISEAGRKPRTWQESVGNLVRGKELNT